MEKINETMILKVINALNSLRRTPARLDIWASGDPESPACMLSRSLRLRHSYSVGAQRSKAGRAGKLFGI
jgi:hypothetical protein